eukprot:m.11959 g.11959  ORF g.11959 m.11959 type:complete len:110 (+) comp23697_c1_seq1:82-411(+)
MEKDQKEVQRLEQELERRLETMMGQDHLLVTRDRTSLSRYLRARDWNVKEAAELLKGTVSWRKKEKPETWTCKWCREKTGYHAMVFISLCFVLCFENPGLVRVDINFYL